MKLRRLKHRYNQYECPWHPDAHGKRVRRVAGKLALRKGMIIETCGCDVAIITHINVAGDDIQYKSLTHPKRWSGSCSIIHCCPMKLTREEAERRIELFKQGGIAALNRRYYLEDCKMPEVEVDKMMAEWHST